MNTVRYEDLLARIKGTSIEKRVDDKIHEFALKIADAYNNAEYGKVHILSDYDCDGICSALILNKLFPDATVHITDRLKDGYGIPPFDGFKEGDMVIISDMGAQEASRIQEIKNITGNYPFVIDHHITADNMKNYPNLLNFHNGDYENTPDWCSTGLCFKLYETMLNSEKAAKLNDVTDRSAVEQKNYDTVKMYAALATVADVCLINNPYDDNRRIVQAGMEVIENIDVSGKMLSVDEPMAYLLWKKGVIGLPHITTEKLQYDIIPIINAMSRITENGGQKAFDYLSSNDYTDGIKEMIDTNEKRKNITKEIIGQESYQSFIQENSENGNNIAVYYNPDIPRGIVGLIASDIVNKLHIPAIVLTNDGILPSLTGSARNADGYPSMIDLCQSDNVLSMGGHAGAFGVSLMPEQLMDFIDDLKENYKDVAPQYEEIETFDVRGLNVDKYMSLEPFGIDFPQPYVNTEGRLTECKYLKGEYMSAKLNIDDNYSLRVFGSKENVDGDAVNMPCNIEGTLSLNMFKGYNGNVSESLQINFDSIEKQKEKDAIVNEVEEDIER